MSDSPEDEIFVRLDEANPDSGKPSEDSTGAPDELEVAPYGEKDESPMSHTTELRVTPDPPADADPAPYGYTKSGRVRKKPLKEQSEEVLEKRRSALEKGREARREKILARKRAVMDFFGEDCLKSNTLKELETAMASAKSSLKKSSKKVWSKPSKTTVKSERVVGAPEKAPAEKPPEKPPAEKPPAEKPPAESKYVWKPKKMKRAGHLLI